MSQPEPLYKLVKQWRNEFLKNRCAGELEAALRAWDTELAKDNLFQGGVREDILGLPAKESTTTQKVVESSQK